MQNEKTEGFQKTLKELSGQDFLGFGLNEISYIRAMGGPAQGTFGLYAANGQLLAVQDSPRTAFSLAINNNLMPVTVH